MRTGIEGAWHQVFGSVAIFAFLVQAVTGILLALNYTPTPGSAYDGLRHIVMQVPGGRLLRALHHWGASLMIIVVVAHLIQVFVWGTYRKPREATWITGVLLLLLTLAFGLSGSLLPWDNRAYWGTAATLRIFGLGPAAINLTRFYGAHVRLLPALMALLIVVHIYLARRDGVTPKRLAKDTVAIFAWFAALMAMSVVARLPLGHVADPTDLSYVSRPDWYFLFLFKGPLEAAGVILPIMAVIALLLIPFIDRGKMQTMWRRVGATGLVALAAIFWGGLTARAVATTPETREMDMTMVKAWQEIPAGVLASIGYFRKAQCGSCHELGKVGTGPERSLDWLEEHVKTNVKGRALTDAQARLLAAFIVQRDDKAVDALRTAPPNMVEGAIVYQENDCGSCHRLNGVGDELGPALNGVGERRDRFWIEQHFADPPKHSPDSIMPSFQFKPDELKAITDYLVAIPK